LDQSASLETASAYANGDLLVKALAVAPDSSIEGEEYTKCLHVLFEAQVARTPDLPALVDGKNQYTYQELNELADTLAAYLRTQGVMTETVVGIFMDRSAEYVIAYLAALKAGAAYCPIELAYPQKQVEDVCENVSAQVILTKRKHLSALPEGETTFCMDASWYEQLQATLPKDGSFWKNQVEPDLDSLCYVVYSSGTTGKPKGITAPHRSPVYSYVWRSTINSYQPGDRVACSVFFVWECLRPLFHGATTYVIPEDVICDSKALVDYLERCEITEILMTPSLLESVLNNTDLEGRRAFKDRLKQLKVVWMNGEVVTVVLRQRFLNDFPGTTRFLNTYSISECGEVCCSDLRKEFRADLTPKFCSVGKPTAFVSLYIVQMGTFIPVATGDIGELYLGGQGLGRGYLNLPTLTSERFFHNPLNGERVYKAGDQARMLADGSVEIQGRCDSMVKIRGYSVVLSAVEEAVRSVVAVKSVLVRVQGEEGSQLKRLVAYIVRVDSEEEVEGRMSDWTVDRATGRCSDLTKRLHKELPQYAVPSVFVEMKGLPTHDVKSASYKVNLKGLPPPPPFAVHNSLDCRSEFRMSAHAPFEQRCDVVRSAMEVALGLEPNTLEQDSDFFQWGGHSLSAAALAGSLRRTFAIEVSIPTILHNRTPSAITNALAGTRDKASLAGVNLALVATMRQEAVLGDVLTTALAAARFPTLPVTLATASIALLTGCTGFFGAFLLARVVKQCPALQVRCLVRGSCPSESLYKSLGNFGLLEGEVVAALASGRVTPVNGDLSKPMFGLTSEAWAGLASQTDIVLHCGAHVNVVLPYSEMRSTNIEGTRTALRLSAEAGAALHFVSTNAVLPWENAEADGARWAENTDLGLIDIARLETGYAQTKWVAESLVWAAAAQGLPVAVYRPGNLGGDSTTGAYNPSDGNVLLLAACAVLGVAPEVPRWLFESSPVDFVAKAVVALASAGSTYGRAVHLTDANPTPAAEVLALMGAAGRPVKSFTSKAEWIAMLIERKVDLGTFGETVVALASDKAVWEPCLFDATEFDAAITAVGLERPHLDAALIGKYIRRMEATGLIA